MINGEITENLSILRPPRRAGYGRTALGSLVSLLVIAGCGGGSPEDVVPEVPCTADSLIDVGDIGPDDGEPSRTEVCATFNGGLETIVGYAQDNEGDVVTDQDSQTLTYGYVEPESDQFVSATFRLDAGGEPDLSQPTTVAVVPVDEASRPGRGIQNSQIFGWEQELGLLTLTVREDGVSSPYVWTSNGVTSGPVGTDSAAQEGELRQAIEELDDLFGTD